MAWIFLLVACQPAATPPPTVASTNTAPATAPAATAEPTPAPAVYDNPIYPADFPDPFVLPVDGAYYAYSTNVGDRNVPVVKISSDFAAVEPLGDALPTLPKWAASKQSLTWAPAILRRGSTYVLYYTARFVRSARQCISRAVSASPAGPFVDDSIVPFLCQLELGGSIDPSPFVDDQGQAYLLWKNDGNCCGKAVGIWIQTLSEDGLSLTGEPVELIRRDQDWEDPLIEGPALVAQGGQYYLFYSGNWWESPDYAMSYAVCAAPTGPCQKPDDEPWFTAAGPALGPGGADFFLDPEGQLWMAYHAWTAPEIGYPDGARSLRIEPLEFVAGQPLSEGPTDDPQPLP